MAAAVTGDRHRAGRRAEVDVLVGLAERRDLGDHVDGGQAGPLERLEQAVATVQQLLDLLAGQLAPPRQLAEHALAVGPRLVDHLAALLLGRRQLGLGVAGGIACAGGWPRGRPPRAPAGPRRRRRAGAGRRRPRPCCGWPPRPRGPSAGCAPPPRRAGGWPSRRPSPSAGSALAWAARSSRSRKRSRSCSRASSAATMRRKSRTSCWSKPRRAVPNAASATAAGDDGSGREKEMATQQSVNVTPPRIAAMAQAVGRERVAAEPLERGERLVERGDGDDLDVVAGDLRGPGRSAPRPGRPARGSAPRRPGARPTPSGPARRSPRPCRRG